MARKFIYDTGEEKLGPVTGRELLRLRAEGEIDDNTWVRPANSRTWRPLRHTDLREEKDKESKRGAWGGLWRVLFRHMSFKTMLVLGLVAIVLLIMLVAVGIYLWPLFLVLLMIWLLGRLIQR